MSYRYTLSRMLPRDLFAGLTDVVGLFIGLNPSTADDHDDDQTVRRWSGYARSWGWCGYHVVNLYGWRATDPKKLWQAADPIGPDNDRWIVQHVLGINGPVVCCWGDNVLKDPKRAAHARAKRVLELLREHAVTPYALRVTRYGQPAHVLRLPGSLSPRPLSELRLEAGCNAL